MSEVPVPRERFTVRNLDEEDLSPREAILQLRMRKKDKVDPYAYEDWSGLDELSAAKLALYALVDQYQTTIDFANGQHTPTVVRRLARIAQKAAVVKQAAAKESQPIDPETSSMI